MADPSHNQNQLDAHPHYNQGISLLGQHPIVDLNYRAGGPFKALLNSSANPPEPVVHLRHLKTMAFGV